MHSIFWCHSNVIRKLFMQINKAKTTFDTSHHRIRWKFDRQLTRGVQTCGAATKIYMCVANERRANIHTVWALKPLLRCTEKPFVFARPLRAYIRNNSAAHSNSRIHLLRSSESRLLYMLGFWEWLLGCLSPDAKAGSKLTYAMRAPRKTQQQ